MHYSGDPYAAPWYRLLLWLQRSFRLGHAFGTEVRMFWVAAILLPLLFLRWTAPFATSLPQLLLLCLLQFVGLFVVIWTHEMGHIAMGRRYGIQTHLITLSPLGGVAHLQASPPSPLAELAIALAGPAVHLAWLLLVWPLDWLRPPDAWFFQPFWFTLWFLGQVNFTLLCFNLLPIFPLDGGRSLRALLAMRWHPGRATLWATSIGIGGGVLLCLYALSMGRIESTILLVIGISCISGCLQERRSLRHLPVYGQAAIAEPWASDPEAWRSGRDAFAGRGPQAERAPGPLARFLLQRRLARQQRQRRAEQEFEAALDAVLVRVKDVGMTGLSEAERELLRQAAKRRRPTG